jgi:hypothetical protein
MADVVRRVLFFLVSFTLSDKTVKLADTSRSAQQAAVLDYGRDGNTTS